MCRAFYITKNTFNLSTMNSFLPDSSLWFHRQVIKTWPHYRHRHLSFSLCLGLIIPGCSWCQQFVPERGRRDSSMCDLDTQLVSVTHTDRRVYPVQPLSVSVRPDCFILASNCLLTSLSLRRGSIRQKMDFTRRGRKVTVGDFIFLLSYPLTEYHQPSISIILTNDLSHSNSINQVDN